MKSEIESACFRWYAGDYARQTVQTQTCWQISGYQRPTIRFLPSGGLECCPVGSSVGSDLKSAGMIFERTQDLEGEWSNYRQAEIVGDLNYKTPGSSRRGRS